MQSAGGDAGQGGAAAADRCAAGRPGDDRRRDRHELERPAALWPGHGPRLRDRHQRRRRPRHAVQRGRPRRQECRGLRFLQAADRLARHARRHHAGDAQAQADPRAIGAGGLLVPDAGDSRDAAGGAGHVAKQRRRRSSCSPAPLGRTSRRSASLPRSGPAQLFLVVGLEGTAAEVEYDDSPAGERMARSSASPSRSSSANRPTSGNG